MKTAYKIVLINLGIAIIITIIELIVDRSKSGGSNTALVFGLVCLGLSLLNLLVGCILALIGKKQFSNGMLLSFAVLLLLSGISCSQGFRLQ